MKMPRVYTFDVPDFDDCGGRTMRRVEVPKAVFRQIEADVAAPLEATIHQLGENAAKAAGEYAEEIEKERAAVRTVQAAFRSFQEAQKPISETYARNSAINREAVETLESERQANALLTAEVERLTPYVEAFRREERRADDLATEVDRLRDQNTTLRHWAWGHIDALLLYAAGSYPKDSHVKEAVAFCRLLKPSAKLRMDPLEASEFHPARAALTEPSERGEAGR